MRSQQQLQKQTAPEVSYPPLPNGLRCRRQLDSTEAVPGTSHDDMHQGNQRGGSELLPGAGARFCHDLGHLPTFTSKLGSWLPEVEDALPNQISEAPLHYPSPLADQYHGRALTIDGSIHLGSNAGQMSRDRFRTLLAHESVHVAQQVGGRIPTSWQNAEMEAHQLQKALLSGQHVEPVFHSTPAIPLKDTSHEQVIVAQARQRLSFLKRYLRERAAREGRRLGMEHEGRSRLLKKRRAMDLAMPVLVPPETYQKIEEAQLAKLNRRPLQIEVTEDVVRFRVRFHVRFEGLQLAAATKSFATLKSNFQAGIRTVWSKQLRGMPLAGRRFELVPELTLVSATAPRDRNFWLITVRPTDKAPMIHLGKKMGTAPGGVPTSVTDPTHDGGVMSIPPSHITHPDVLGHEVLHIFGLVDRYLSMTQKLPSGRRRHTSAPLRDTKGRRDPLGGEEGSILAEDLNFLFEKLGVYQMEENRGLAALRAIEKTERLSYGQVIAEIHRLEGIVKTGRDPHSLIPVRRDFREQILRSAEDLP